MASFHPSLKAPRGLFGREGGLEVFEDAFRRLQEGRRRLAVLQRHFVHTAAEFDAAHMSARLLESAKRQAQQEMQDTLALREELHARLALQLEVKAQIMLPS